MLCYPRLPFMLAVPSKNGKVFAFVKFVKNLLHSKSALLQTANYLYLVFVHSSYGVQ